MERKKFAVIGLGRFGLKLVEELNKMGLEVLAIDKEGRHIEKIRDIASESLILDATDRDALEKSGIKNVDCAIISLGDDMEKSILTTTVLREFGLKEIIVRAESPIHAEVLRKVGATKVIFPEEDMAVRLAHAIHFPGVQEYINIKGPYDLAEFKVSSKSKLVGKKVGKLLDELKEKISILMIEKEDEKEVRKIITLRDDYVIEVNDILILFANPENLKNFIERN